MTNDLNCSVSGRAFDAPTACYTTSEPESLVGVEITDLNGRLEQPHVGVFITCAEEGRKVFLRAEAARDLAGVLISMADLLDAGATSTEAN